MSGSRWVTTPHGYQYNHGYSSSVYFYIVLLCILAHLFLISSASVRFFCFFPLLRPSLHEIFPWYLPSFLKRSLSSPFCCFPLFCIVYLRRLSYLSLPFSGTLHSVGYAFPFLFCFPLVFFFQLFVRLPQTTTLSSCISLSLGWFWPPPPVQC